MMSKIRFILDMGVTLHMLQKHLLTFFKKVLTFFDGKNPLGHVQLFCFFFVFLMFFFFSPRQKTLLMCTVGNKESHVKPPIHVVHTMDIS